MISENNNKFEYFAFISYNHLDEKWAKWLQKKLEYYKVPAFIKEEKPDLPNKIRPIFRDQSDLSSGKLKKEIEKALKVSQYLIVVCSPNASKSDWVSDEVELFIKTGREDFIIPFIVDGTPNSPIPEEECFPMALRQLNGDKEILGINVNEIGKEAAFIKVVARLFNVKFDSLWKRHEKEKRKQKIRKIFLLSLFIAFLIGIIVYISILLFKSEKENGKVLSSQIYANLEDIGGEKATSELIKIMNEKPYSPEIERGIRYSLLSPKRVVVDDLDLDFIDCIPSSNNFFGINLFKLYLIERTTGNILYSEPFNKMFSKIKKIGDDIFFESGGKISRISVNVDRIYKEDEWLSLKEYLFDFDILMRPDQPNTIALFTKDNVIKIITKNDTILLPTKENNYGGKLTFSKQKPVIFISDGKINNFNEGYIFCYDYKDQKTVWKNNVGVRIDKFLPINNESQLLVLGRDNIIRILNSQNGDLLKEYDPSFAGGKILIKDFCLSANERFLYYGLSDGNVYKLDLDNDESSFIFSTDRFTVSAMDLSNDGEDLIVSTDKNTYVCSLRNYVHNENIKSTGIEGVNDLLMTKDGEHLIMPSYRSPIYIYSLKDDSLHYIRNPKLNSLIFSSKLLDPSLAKIECFDQIIFNNLTDSLLKDKIESKYENARVSENGNLICLIDGSNNFCIFDKKKKQIVLDSEKFKFAQPDFRIHESFIDENKNQIIIPVKKNKTESGMVMIDINTGKIKKQIYENFPMYIDNILTSPDKKYLIVVGSDYKMLDNNHIYIFKYDNLSFLYKKRLEDKIYSIDISPDSRYFVTSQYMGVVRFWDLVSGLEISPAIQLDMYIINLKWSDDSEKIYLCDYDGNISTISFESWDSIKKALSFRKGL
ncbi:MAG: toll/interleukin-1 receptor domain-containing protein [Muribaculaceae bacterium]|nr:toll/interleukin-1 receptor domain-containing protein [Muribaculaceae bacterium]